MEGIFQTQGITESVPSDNGTPFSSAEFEGCLVYLGPAHPKRIPYWPQSNGEVERCNKTLLKEGKDRKKARAVRQQTVLKLGTSAIQSGGKKGNAVLIEDQGGNTKLRNVLRFFSQTLELKPQKPMEERKQRTAGSNCFDTANQY